MKKTNEVKVEEPVTPMGEMFLEPNVEQITHYTIGLKNPIDVDAVKSEIICSGMMRIPRFTNLLVRDSRGRQYWRRTQVDVDRHVIIRNEPLPGGEDAVNEYLADLSISSPLSSDKPLWEIHLLMAHNCVLLRVHHAIGDGTSILSMLQLCFRRSGGAAPTTTVRGLVGDSSSSSVPRSWWRRRKWSWWNLWMLVKVVCYTLFFAIEVGLRSMWLKDNKSPIIGGAGVELWPRRLVTAKFRLDDMKVVKKAVVGATINDVVLGIISYGLSRYLGIRSPPHHDQGLLDGVRMTGVVVVNLRLQPGLQDVFKLLNGKSDNWFGNQISCALFPVFYDKKWGGSDPLEFVRRAKRIMDKKKLSLAAALQSKVCHFLSKFVSPKMNSSIFYNLSSNTTFMISNMIGPNEEMKLMENPVTYLRVSSISSPHAILMHIVNYGGRADMQISVAKDIIPDPQLLGKCFEDVLSEMKHFAMASMNKT